MLNAERVERRRAAILIDAASQVLDGEIGLSLFDALAKTEDYAEAMAEKHAQGNVGK